MDYARYDQLQGSLGGVGDSFRLRTEQHLTGLPEDHPLRAVCSEVEVSLDKLAGHILEALNLATE